MKPINKEIIEYITNKKNIKNFFKFIFKIVDK